MKRQILVCFILLLALQLTGCGQSEDVKRLEHFKGGWTGTFFVFPAVNAIKTTVNQPDSNTISFDFSIYEYSPGGFRNGHGDRLAADSERGTPRLTCSFNLRYDPTQKKYFLNAGIGRNLQIRDLPLTYSAGQGYAGKGTTAVGSERTTSVEVKIEDHLSSSQWTISFAGSDWKEQFVLMLNTKSPNN